MYEACLLLIGLLVGNKLEFVLFISNNVSLIIGQVEALVQFLLLCTHLFKHDDK